jgi:hypothetical protein
VDLSPTVHDIYNNLVTKNNFPYYSTKGMMDLSATQANALKYYTSAIADYYMLPHLRKNNTGHHFCKDPSGQSATAVQMLLRDAVINLQISDCREIFDVVYCPILSGVLIFYKSTNVLCVQLSRLDLSDNLESVGYHVLIGGQNIAVNSAFVFFAEYQGNVLCMRVNDDMYTLTSIETSAKTFTLSKMAHIPFLPSLIW